MLEYLLLFQQLANVRPPDPSPKLPSFSSDLLRLPFFDLLVEMGYEMQIIPPATSGVFKLSAVEVDVRPGSAFACTSSGTRCLGHQARLLDLYHLNPFRGLHLQNCLPLG